MKLLLAAVAVLSYGQQFEAASVKPLKDSAVSFHFTVSPNRLDVKNMNLINLIEQAYDLADYQVSFSDAILRDIPRSHVDIQATTDVAVPRAEMMAMLQNLFIERYHLATRWDTRTCVGYRLEVMPGGPKMKPSEQGYAIPNSPMNDGAAVEFNGPMTMRQLSERLNGPAGKIVVDATGLEGFFNIKLRFASTDISAVPDSGPPAALLPNAIKEQLGLRLVPGKQSVKVLVVDHADAIPVAN